MTPPAPGCITARRRGSVGPIDAGAPRGGGMHEYEYHLVEEVRAGRLTRRQMIVRATVAGLSASSIGTLLAACGGSSSSKSTSTSTAAAAGAVKRGGTFRLGCAVPTADVDPVFLFDQGGIFTAQLA